jgi:diguanylate cyclase (GGDEF)-like protein
VFVSFAVIAICVLTEVVSLAAVGLTLRSLYRRFHDLRAAAGIDSLTGVLGRQGLLDCIAVFGRSSPPGVLLLDLLRFKDINDRWGHDTGDDLLIAVAERLADVAAAFGAVVGRLGGDEFVILLPGDPSDAELTALAEQIQQALAEPVFVATAGVDLQVAVVIGAAPAMANPMPGKPFRAADIACYHARHHRQPFVIYRPGMVHPASEQRHGERLRDLRPAPTAAVFDRLLFARLVAGDVSSERAHPDDVAALGDLLDVLDPRGRDFATDVQELVHRCVEHGVLQVFRPVEDVHIEPTIAGETRDGGFRVLASLTSGPILASPQLTARAFTELSEPVAVAVMDAVAEAVTASWDRYRNHLSRADW